MPRVDAKGFVRFLRYSAIGLSTFLFDLALIYGLTEYAHIPYYASTFLGFLIAVSVNYVLSRRIVFSRTERAYHHGYAYFLALALLAGATITGLVFVLVTFGGLPYLLARILIGGFTGMLNYLLNLHFNFRVAGLH